MEPAISRAKTPIINWYLTTLTVITLLTLSTTASVAIQNFRPKYEQILRNMPKGSQLLQKIDSFLNHPQRDKPLLDSIIASGNIYGHHDFEQIYGVFEYLFRSRPSLVKGFHTIGKSFQNIEIMAVRIGKGESNQTEFLNSVYSEPEIEEKTQHEPKFVRQKSIMFFNGAHHSRDLITTGMSFKIALEALHDLTHNDSSELTFWEFSDVLLVPVVNIDGYKFISDSQRKTDDFLTPVQNDLENDSRFTIPMYSRGKNKRKNMNTNFCLESSDGVDIGVDLNRNYGVKWGQSGTQNESEECQENFKGSHPFSEPETQAIRDLLVREKEYVVMAVQFHSDGNNIHMPVNYSKTPLKELFKYGSKVSDFYTQMNAEILESSPDTHVGVAYSLYGYTSFGEASDWIFNELKIISYTFDLGPVETSEDQTPMIWCPKDLITPTIDENFETLKLMVAKTRFNITDSKAYLDSSNTFVVQFENNSIGKLFNGKIRIRASDPQFFRLCKDIHIQQRQLPKYEYDFLLYDSNDQVIYSRTPKSGMKNLNVLAMGDEAYLEILVPQIDNLANLKVFLQMSDDVDSLGKIDFEFSLIFEDIYLLSRFEVGYHFGPDSFWKIAFIVAAIMNLFFFTTLMMNLSAWSRSGSFSKNVENTLKAVSKQDEGKFSADMSRK